MAALKVPMQPFVKLHTIEISQYWLIPITDPNIGATLIVTAKVTGVCGWLPVLQMTV